MSFCDLGFIFIFLPLFVMIHHAAPPSAQKHLLFGGGLLFWGAGLLLSPPESIIAAASFPAVLLFTWGASRLIYIRRAEGGSGGRALLYISAALLAGFLALFKYFTPPVPAGMSFYIFTAIALLADVYRGTSPAGGFVETGAHLAMFPKLLSGPIVRYKDVMPQLDGHGCTSGALAEGIRQFIEGLALKVLLADTVGRLWTSICAVGIESISTPVAWLGAAAFSIQLYLDFHGYSLMACGIGKMIGVELPRNFDYPYMSRSVSEFWRRWHITLGLWFREYVYIPLGGSRRGKAALLRNLLAVWLLTGIWHGSTLNFVLWGFMMFVLIAAEKLVYGEYLKRHRALSHIYLLLVMPLSWMLFANTDIGVMLTYFGRLFSFSGGIAGIRRFIGSYAVSLPAGALFCTPVPAKLFGKIRLTFVGALIYAALFAASVYVIWLSGSGPFMYFSF